MKSSITPEIENPNSKIQNPPLPVPSPLPPVPSPLCPPGSLTLLLGEPGAGKSLLALDLAARLSRGIPLPSFSSNPKPSDPEPSDPSSSVILSREDTTDTLYSRLAAANANLDFISLPGRLLSLVPETPLHRQNTPIAISPLTKFLLLHLKKIKRPRLLILDPLPAFLGTADSSSAGLIRTLLDPLFLLAEHHNLAILGISHLNKSTHKKTLLHRSLGSQAYPALARTVYLLARDTSDPSVPQSLSASVPSHTRRLLLPIKSNFTPGDRALAFQITPSATLDWEKSPITDHPLLHSAISTQSTPLQDPFAKSQLEFAIDFVKQTLDAGPVPSNNLLKEARSLGISTRTYHRARFHLQVACHRDAQNHQWLSYLPTL